MEWKGGEGLETSHGSVMGMCVCVRVRSRCSSFTVAGHCRVGWTACLRPVLAIRS